ncbi:MarR family transcriptional regulator [Streptomyces sp. CBMA123]|uniref:MarR family transcriptional regulator n=1 Tax=Streptomyces sp. CBMA123 TaxID=1896313 RepID=UPI001661C8D9|nr:helix-turn-helix domain-containing protein [Streptomyces sp. CBMA123]
MTGDLIRVVTLVQDYGWKSGFCFAADETLGRQLGLSRGGVNRLIARAKAKDLVRATRNPATGTMNRRVRPPADDELTVCVGSYARASLAGTRFKVYALLTLRQHFPEPTPVVRIARECGMKEATAREAVAELLAQGWVSRRAGGRRAYRYVVHPVPLRVPNGQPESLPSGHVPAPRSAGGSAGDGVGVLATGPDSRHGDSLDPCREAAGSVTADPPAPVTLATPYSVAETRSSQHDLLNTPAVVGGCPSREPATVRTRARDHAAGTDGDAAGPARRDGRQTDRKTIRSVTDEQKRWGRQAASSALSRLPRQLADRLTERQLDLLAQHIVATFADYGTSPDIHGAVVLEALESAWEFARRREPVGAVPWSSVVSPLPWLIKVVDRASETVTGSRPVRSPECALCRGPLVARDADDPETCRSCGPAAAAAACRRLREQWEPSGHAPPSTDPLTMRVAPGASGPADRSAAGGDESEGTILRRRLVARRLERERTCAQGGEALPTARPADAARHRRGATGASTHEAAGRRNVGQVPGHGTGPRDAPPEAVAASDPAPRGDGRPDAGKTGTAAAARPCLRDATAEPPAGSTSPMVRRLPVGARGRRGGGDSPTGSSPRVRLLPFRSSLRSLCRDRRRLIPAGSRTWYSAINGQSPPDMVSKFPSGRIGI